MADIPPIKGPDSTSPLDRWGGISIDALGSEAVELAQTRCGLENGDSDYGQYLDNREASLFLSCLTSGENQITPAITDLLLLVEARTLEAIEILNQEIQRRNTDPSLIEKPVARVYVDKFHFAMRSVDMLKAALGIKKERFNFSPEMCRPGYNPFQPFDPNCASDYVRLETLAKDEEGSVHLKDFLKRIEPEVLAIQSFLSTQHFESRAILTVEPR